MENCFLGHHQEYDSWINYGQSDQQWVPPPAEAAALPYHCYHLPPSWVAAPPYEGVAEDRTAAASRSHSEAEKRRRDRINAQLATLRKLIPKSEKMDKAALLAHVVDHVKEQSKKAKEISKFSTIPAEIDEVKIDYLNADETISQDNQNIYIKGSICCEDRPELFAELSSAIKGLSLTIAEADITSLGGRMITNFLVCGKDTNPGKHSLKQSLKLALSRLVISSGVTSYSARSKRQRFFYPNSR